MKLYHYLIFVFFICMSCSSSDFSENQSGIIIGRIYVIGNVPFTKIGLQVSETKILILKTDKDIENMLLKHQGEEIKITFRGTEKSAEGTTLKVTRADLINKN